MKEHPHASGDELQRLFMEKVRDDEDAKHAMLKMSLRRYQAHARALRRR
jgi:hypothetical protein